MAGGEATGDDGPPQAPTQDWKTKGKAAWAQVRLAWDKALLRIEEDKTGLLALLVVAVVCFVLTAIFYTPLGWPARALNLLASRIPDGSCSVENTPGTLSFWFCGAGLALVSVIGSLVVVAGLWLARRHIKKGIRWTAQRLPKALRFLDKPVATTIVFAMAWSGIEFHFYRRTGFLLDGLFPAVMGLVMFALVRWDDPVKRGLGPVWPLRDRLNKWARIGILVAIPFLLALLLTPIIHSAKRDQLVAVVGLVLGWIMFTQRPESAPPPKAKPTTATSLVVGTGLVVLFLLVVAVPVSAFNHCTVNDTFTADYAAACEEAHHNATMGTAGGVIAIGTTAVLVPTGREDEEPEEDEEEEPEEEVDPCLGLQNDYDSIRGQILNKQSTLETMRSFLRAREQEYLRRKESTFWGQAVDTAFLGSGMAAKGGGQAAGALATLWNVSKAALRPAVTKAILQKAMVQGGQAGLMEAAYGLAGKIPDDNVVAQFQALVKGPMAEVMMETRSQQLAQRGFKEGTPVFNSMLRNFQTESVEALSNAVQNIANIGGAVHTGWTWWGQWSELDDFRDRVHKFSQQIIDVEGDLGMLKDRLRPAELDLENCRERVSMGLPV